MYVVNNVLTSNELAECREILQQADWADGKITAGTQAAVAKNNLQLPEKSTASLQLREIVLAALSRNAKFFTAALPKKIYPPYFNRYTGTQNSFGNHVDNAIRTDPMTARHVRTDMSFTLFLNEPEEYEGGELVMVEDATERAVKLAAGDLILYPSYVVHRVNPVTSGQRLACFSWLESMVRNPQERSLLYDLDMAIMNIRTENGETPAAIQLTNCYHNLMRMWADI